MILATVTHDIKSNTLEALWLDEIRDEAGEVVAYEQVKRRNYSAEQKDEFLSDCGEGADKYTQMAGW